MNFPLVPPVHRLIKLEECQHVFKELSKIRLVATDMDGTLTKNGKFTSVLLQAWEKLACAGIQVMIVTGRSAGWVNGISSLMDIGGAIAENGGLFYPPGNLDPITLTPISDFTHHRQQLAAAFAQLLNSYPTLCESHDNRFRLTDWTFDVAGLTLPELQHIDYLCQQMGWGFTYSNVQCHIKPQQQDKATGLKQVINQYFPSYSPAQIMTVGDSPNDESLFNPDEFPLSVGVANILKYAEQLQHQPLYITEAAEGEGFCELSEYILTSLSHPKS
ncbi:HAD-superfamily hydrolase, subfamily IIB [Richelia sinica FACHB-800]|uniref:HAD-superfamily hydrolase, subfamily IIB n=2 Tax=Richelia TaxID=98443 RepID=A0A975T6Z0_9NOST|nr:HAD family phosphatase [Richelia sinica FACHB-800]QXE23343.1 HAD-superfamily hydrolase, subfamily IIB [Richelia sinica FACHB-800]